MSAGRIYDKIKDKTYVRVIFITNREVICEFVNEKELSKEIEAIELLFKKWEREEDNIESYDLSQTKPNIFEQLSDNPIIDDDYDDKLDDEYEDELKDDYDDIKIEFDDDESDLDDMIDIEFEDEDEEIIPIDVEVFKGDGKIKLTDDIEIDIEDLLKENSGNVIAFAVDEDNDEINILSEEEIEDMISNADFEEMDRDGEELEIDFQFLDEDGNPIDDDEEIEIDIRDLGMQIASELRKSINGYNPAEFTSNQDEEKIQHDEIAIIAHKKEELIEKYFQIKEAILSISDFIEFNIKKDEIQFYYKDLFIATMSIKDNHILIVATSNRKIETDEKIVVTSSKLGDSFLYNVIIEKNQSIKTLIELIKEIIK
jgi:hypothetical protein